MRHYYSRNYQIVIKKPIWYLKIWTTRPMKNTEEPNVHTCNFYQFIVTKIPKPKYGERKTSSTHEAWKLSCPHAVEWYRSCSYHPAHKLTTETLNVLQNLKYHRCQLKLLYPAKLSITMWRKQDSQWKKVKLKQYPSTKTQPYRSFTRKKTPSQRG